jgi:hypothetical protein
MIETAPPREVFFPWARAQREADRLAYETPPAPRLTPELAGRIAAWYLSDPAVPDDAVRAAYRALERETARLYDVTRRLGVRVELVYADDDPYRDAAELCAELRGHGSMKLRTIACDPPHPLLGGEPGGSVDQLRVVHDVFGHAALGLGFDLQSEYATWLQCRTLFSPEARGAAFCELVGAVTAFVMTGFKPALRADLPPEELSTKREEAA